ncbi:MAG: 30S ribosomal protein S14 [Oceanococcaceae bacterium]
MAKKSMIAREHKRAQAALRFAKKRTELKAVINNPNTPFDEKFQAVQALAKLPRDGSVVRRQTRCAITGRPHAVYKRFGLCRNKLRELAMKGEIPGLTMSSW